MILTQQNLQGSGNLNSSMKKTSGGAKSSGLRTSTGRSMGVPGAESTKGSNSSQVIRK